jgi:CHRD domain-containing protein
MRTNLARAAVGVALLTVVGFGSYAMAGGGTNNVKNRLETYQEVPAVSSNASGQFSARITDDSSIEWTLDYENLTGSVTQAHIHFGQTGVNGGISIFLCSNLGNGPAGTQPCPSPSASLSGTATAAGVVGPAAQGIAPGEFSEILAAIRAGKAYANVHSTTWPGGEIRAQLHDESNDG